MVTVLHSCLLLCLVVVEIYSNPIVGTTQGILKGQYLTTAKNRSFSSFTAIRYAEPPIGNLRFKLAKPARPWVGIRDATQLHAVCPQSNLYFGDPTVFGNEDCLFLNVYSPELTFPTWKRRPVMIFIHGGAFLFGSGNREYYDPRILLDKDVVLVAPNYRLGSLGFISTGDNVVSGNLGLKDQNLVIKWVKQNIQFFGGDPNDITVFGQSAGAASAHFHMLSPLSRGLISKVISDSGTALAPWAVSPNDECLRNSRKLAQEFNCSVVSSQSMISCLRNVDAADLIRIQDTFYVWSIDPIVPFKVVIEPNVKGAFLTQHPADIIKSGKAAKIPFVTGINTEEGAIRASSIFGISPLLQQFNDDFQRIAPYTFLYEETAPNKDYVTNQIREFYFNNLPIDTSNYSHTQVTNVYTDAYFLWSAKLAVRLHRQYTRQKVYMYVFGYRGTISYSSLLGDPSYNYGVSHSDELFYLFPPGSTFPGYVPSEADNRMRDVLSTLWTNVAKFGNPTPITNSVIPTKWNPVSSNNLEYYFIKNYTNISMQQNLYPERSQFWEQLPIH